MEWWSFMTNLHTEFLLETIHALIQSGEDVNDKVFMNATPLHFASEGGHLGLVKLLLDKNANINATADAGFTSLHLAIAHCHLEVSDYLIQKGANVNALTAQDWSPLHYTACNGFSLKILKDLIVKGANVNARQNDGKTALHLAAEHNHLEIVKFLIENGANVNAADKKRWTPLHCAAHDGNLEVAKTLIRKGVNVDAKAVANNTPLHLAVENYHLEVVELLLKKGADVNALDNENWTPLHFAVGRAYDRIVLVLLKYKADINAKATRVVLYRAPIFFPHLIGGTGIDRAIKNVTPLFLAGTLNHHKIVFTLLQHGAMFEVAITGGRIINFADHTRNNDIIAFSQMIKRFFEETKKGNYQIVPELKRMKNRDLKAFLAILNGRNNQKHTIIQIALVNKHTDIASALTHALREGNEQESGTTATNITGLMSSCSLSSSP